MASVATVQVLDSTIDTVGLSIITATKTADAPRQGMVYNPLTLAAAVPVWFHQLNSGAYLMVMNKRWYGATISTSGGGPQSYSAHTETTTPSWVQIDPTTGHTTGAITEFDSATSGDRVLNGAFSRLDYLFTSGAIGGVPHVGHYRVTSNGVLVMQDEELIPPIDVHGPAVGDDPPPVIATVNFSAGCYIDGDFLVVLGTDADHNVYKTRRNWGRIGGSAANAQGWTYWGAKGWLGDPDTLVPLPLVASGGTVSYASSKDREYLGVSNGGHTEVWSSRRVETPWTQETSILSPTAWLQPQLHPSASASGVPYVSTTIDTTSGAQSLQVAWGLHGV